MPELPSTLATFGHVPVLVRTWEQVHTADWPTLISPLGPGSAGDAFAFGVDEVLERQGHVADVVDDDLVVHRLAEHAGQFFLGEVAVFFDPLELFDREGRFGAAAL